MGGHEGVARLLLEHKAEVNVAVQVKNVPTAIACSDPMIL
jgi:hypothetical protein